jgi:hypothetical protein
MAKVIGPFRDSHAPFWQSEPRIDVPAEHPSNSPCRFRLLVIFSGFSGKMSQRDIDIKRGMRSHWQASSALSICLSFPSASVVHEV